jgi:hypothetical protein
MAWLSFLRPGDWLVVLLATTLTGISFPLLWHGNSSGDRIVVRQDGHVFAQADLKTRHHLEVPGPLGTTVIEVEPGRARVQSDPGLRQYCVRQGWLTRAGEIAICAPNRVSLEIAGKDKAYDSLSY